MKIKRFDNLWTMGVILSAVILLSVYLLKILIPEFVVEVAQIKSITKLGHYIDTHKWAWYLASSVFSFITYYLLCCACASKKKLNIKEILIVCTFILIGYFVKEVLPTYYTTINYIFMILLPYMTNGKMKNTVVSFSLLNFFQVFTLEIRGIGLMVANFNYATFTILTIDFYILQVLLYLLFNNKKEN